MLFANCQNFVFPPLPLSPTAVQGLSKMLPCVYIILAFTCCS